MKKVFIIIAVCIFNFSNILAQQENNKDQWHKNYDHMISNKIAFFTQELDLTPKEAVQYWAVYNQCWDSLMVQGYKVRKALKSLKEAMDNTQKKGDTQIKELMDTYFEACDKEMEAKKTMFKELCKVVPVDKLSVVITLVLSFVFLHEQFTTKSLIGCILIGIGTLIMVL